MTKYIIDKVSCMCHEKPHKDAVHETIDTFEFGYCSREFLRDKLQIKNWKEYKNYTAIKNGKETVFCRRPIKKAEWIIEIDDLERFTDENGDLVISQKDDFLPYRKITLCV